MKNKMKKKTTAKAKKARKPAAKKKLAMNAAKKPARSAKQVRHKPDNKKKPQGRLRNLTKGMMDKPEHLTIQELFHSQAEQQAHPALNPNSENWKNMKTYSNIDVYRNKRAMPKFSKEIKRARAGGFGARHH